jgi:hypothetical protein
VTLLSVASRAVAAVWVALILVRLLDVSIHLSHPGGIWIVTSAALWALTSRPVRA